MDEQNKTCGKCDINLKEEDKVIDCFTCKQLFHINCQGVSVAKYEILSDTNDNPGMVWFCRTCQRTTAGMFQHIVNLELRLKAIEDEREKEKHEVTVLRKLVSTLNQTINSVEESIVNVKEENDSIKDAVTCMLNEIPQCTSIEARFSSIENTLKEVSSVNSSVSTLQSYADLDSSTCSQSIINYSDFSTVEIANELDDRQRRKGNVVLHNVPETGNQESDEHSVISILNHVLGEEVNYHRDSTTDMPRIYRLGNRIPGKTRSIKCHLQSKEMCAQVLSRSRRLSESNNFSQVVLQEDMTPMQRAHIRQLVIEKKKRNFLAQKNNLTPDWVIRSGKLQRKTDYKVSY